MIDRKLHQYRKRYKLRRGGGGGGGGDKKRERGKLTFVILSKAFAHVDRWC